MVPLQATAERSRWRFGSVTVPVPSRDGGPPSILRTLPPRGRPDNGRPLPTSRYGRSGAKLSSGSRESVTRHSDATLDRVSCLRRRSLCTRERRTAARQSNVRRRPPRPPRRPTRHPTKTKRREIIVARRRRAGSRDGEADDGTRTHDLLHGNKISPGSRPPGEGPK
jgi:hypothetical protein